MNLVGCTDGIDYGEISYKEKFDVVNDARIYSATGYLNDNDFQNILVEFDLSCTVKNEDKTTNSKLSEINAKFTAYRSKYNSIEKFIYELIGKEVYEGIELRYDSNYLVDLDSKIGAKFYKVRGKIDDYSNQASLLLGVNSSRGENFEVLKILTLSLISGNLFYGNENILLESDFWIVKIPTVVGTPTIKINLQSNSIQAVLSECKKIEND